jgi:hypothetical protein
MGFSRLQHYAFVISSRIFYFCLILYSLVDHPDNVDVDADYEGPHYTIFPSVPFSLLVLSILLSNLLPHSLHEL